MEPRATGLTLSATRSLASCTCTCDAPDVNRALMRETGRRFLGPVGQVKVPWAHLSTSRGSMERYRNSREVPFPHTARFSPLISSPTWNSLVLFSCFREGCWLVPLPPLSQAVCETDRQEACRGGCRPRIRPNLNPKFECAPIFPHSRFVPAGICFVLLQMKSPPP